MAAHGGSVAGTPGRVSSAVMQRRCAHWWLLGALVAACGPQPVDSPQRDAALPDATSFDAALPDAPGAADAAAPGLTRVRVHYDTGLGHRIVLRGDGAGLSWDSGQDCQWSDGNIWRCELAPADGVIEFKPLVDDATWARGTNWRVVAGTSTDIYPHFHATVGRLVRHAGFHSALLGNDRDLVVYLPPGYDENSAARYPLLVVHDGQNLFEPSESATGVAWELDAAVDALVAGAGITPMIIAGIANTGGDRLSEYTPTVDAELGGGAGATYLDFLVGEVRPALQAAYRTTGGRVGLAGSSLGGLITLHGCWTRPSQFERCGVFSPSLWWDDGELLARIAADPDGAAEHAQRLYVDSGDQGPSMDGMTATAMLRDLLVAKGWGDELRYVLGIGHAHDESAWAARAPDALRFLYADPARAP